MNARDDPTTDFAPAARKPDDRLGLQVAAVAASPVVDALLKTCGGLVAVLNAERQVIGLNHALLEVFGIPDPAGALGLRLGEALQCVHHRDHPAGCGCSGTCRTCGAAVAMVAALERHETVERDCVVTATADGAAVDLTFRVRAAPVDLDGQRVLLVFLEDVTRAREQAELARVFFHDVSNLVQALQAVCQLLPGSSPGDTARRTTRAHDLVQRLAREVAIQRVLVLDPDAELNVQAGVVDVSALLAEVEAQFADHPLLEERSLACRPAPADLRVRTDRILTLRILANMVTNSLEATPAGGVASLWCEPDGERVRFCVHNDGVVPPAVASRVFQRHFSTKEGDGRGLGAFAMKLLGERYLGGAVDFVTNTDQGTTFRLSLSRA